MERWLPPRGGGALYSHLNDASHAQNASTQNFSQPAEKAAHDAAILSGEGLGLDPENDPIIATTEYGLDIKFHQTISVDYLGEGVKFAGYPYITAAGVNWVIIGQSDKGLITEYDSSPAGLAIKNDENKFVRTVIRSSVLWYDIFKDVTISSELELGEVLCFAQTIVTDSIFAPSGGTAYTNTTTLYSTCNTWYNNNLKSSLDSYIVEKTLITQYNNGKTTVTAKLFPLAAYDKDSIENYHWSSYLVARSDNIDVGRAWWLRSGNQSNDRWPFLVSSGGYVSSGYEVSSSAGVRPAFVLKI